MNRVGINEKKTINGKLLKIRQIYIINWQILVIQAQVLISVIQWTIIKAGQM